MDCKHLSVEGRTTKYYYCRAKQKSINDYDCRTCMLKISDVGKTLENIFGGFNGHK